MELWERKRELGTKYGEQEIASLTQQKGIKNNNNGQGVGYRKRLLIEKDILLFLPNPERRHVHGIGDFAHNKAKRHFT